MRAKKFVCCLLAMMLLAGVSFISCGNSSKAKADSELTTQDGEDFKSFLDKFTSSAAFQYKCSFYVHSQGCNSLKAAFSSFTF
jgi:hypothetical protein